MPHSSSSPMVVIGQLGAPFGVHGYLKVIAFSETPQRLLDYQPWQFEHAGKIEPCALSGIMEKNGQVYVQINHCHDRDVAKRYTNLKILIPRTQLPELPEGEYYWSDLEGLEVYQTTGTYLGVVDYLMSTPAHDILVIQNPETKTEVLIPFVLDTIILKVDLKNKRIEVAWEIP